MDAFTILILFLLTYCAGVVTHWWSTRKQRSELKAYRQQEQDLIHVMAMRRSGPVKRRGRK
jgi:hypothetical protein